MFASKFLRIIFYVLIFSIYMDFVLSWKKQSFSNSSQNFHELICQEDTVHMVSGASYIWSAKSSDDSIQYATSENFICINNITSELIIRKCDPLTNEWIPSSSLINCRNIPSQSNFFCPEDLTEILVHGKYFCLKIIDRPHTFNERYCYGSDTLFGEESINALDISTLLRYLRVYKDIQKFWISVRRAEYNRHYNPFVIKLPGNEWGEVYDSVSTSLPHYFTDQHCIALKIIFENKTITYINEITNCNDLLPSICIFRKDMVAYSGCPQGFGALSHRPSECYGIELEVGSFPYELKSVSVAEYISKRNSLKHIFRSIDLDNSSYFLVGNFSTRNNISYAIEMNINENFRIVPFDKKRYALSSEILSDFNRKSVEMVLKTDPEMRGLTLTVYNRNYIWRFSDEDNFGIKCFTNSGTEQWKSVKIEVIWQNYLETKALFTVKLEKNTGYYWCEAHTIFDFSLVKTQKVVVSQERKEHTFALLFDIPCENKECYNIYNKNTWKRLNKKLKNIFSDLQRGHRNYKELELNSIRLMDIVTVAKDGSGFLGLVHVSAFLKSFSGYRTAVQSSEELESEKYELFFSIPVLMKVRDMLANLVSQFYFMHVGFVRSTQFCFPEYFNMTNGNQNYWLSSKYGEISTTGLICLQENGVPFIRACQGDFLWGAYWENNSNIKEMENCDIDRKSNVTHKLQSLRNEKMIAMPPERMAEEVRFLLEHNLQKLIPADLYFMSQILQRAMYKLFKSKYQYESKTSMYTFISNKTVTDIVKIYDFLSNVNIEVFKRSVALNTTNILLEVFERLVDEIALEENRANATNIEVFVNTSNFDLKATGNIKSNNFINDKKIEGNQKPMKVANNVHDSIKTLTYEDIGVIVKSTSSLIIFVIDPTIANITGVALFLKESNYSNNEETSTSNLFGEFEKERYKFLLANQSVDNLIYEKNLYLATYVPETLLYRLDEISLLANFSLKRTPITKIVIKIYANTLFFQTNDKSSNIGSIGSIKNTSNRVVSVSIPGHSNNLPEMLPLLFKIHRKDVINSTHSICNYWNYNTWVNDGLIYLSYSEENDVILCGSTHLTPFAYLIGDSYKLSVDSEILVVVKTHMKVLDAITILGCSLSLLGIFGIFLTALTFQSWRRKASSKVLLELSAAISLQMIIFCFVNTEENSRNLMANDIFLSCIIIGALMHYSVLVQFSWMLIIGYLQFKRYVQIFGNIRPKRFLQKASVIGWGVPVIPVLVVLFLDKESYIPDKQINNPTICYPSGYSLYLAVILPITVIISGNCGMFATILYSLLWRQEKSIRHTEKGLALSQLRLSALLFFLLGFTWIFGILAAFKAGLMFSYLFCLTATLQGFVLFIYFIILDPKTRCMWGGFFENVCGFKESYEARSIKETTETLQQTL